MFSITQTRLHSWRLTSEDPWPLEWWAAPALQGLQESQEFLALLGIQVLVDHQGTEACRENSETQVPEVRIFYLLVGAQKSLNQRLISCIMT